MFIALELEREDGVDTNSRTLEEVRTSSGSEDGKHQTLKNTESSRSDGLDPDLSAQPPGQMLKLPIKSKQSDNNSKHYGMDHSDRLSLESLPPKVPSKGENKGVKTRQPLLSKRSKKQLADMLKEKSMSNDDLSGENKFVNVAFKARSHDPILGSENRM